MLGGFENLPGHMQFWDKNKLKKMGDAQHHSARIFEWSPDGRSFVTAVVHPFRRVDNKVCVWKYNGELLYEESAPELYQALYRPALDGVYPDRPQSPAKKAPAVAAVSTDAASSSASSAAGASAAAPPAAAKPAPSGGAAPKSYVPPHMRNAANAAERVKITAISGPVAAPRRIERPVTAKAVPEPPVAAKPANLPVGMAMPVGMAAPAPQAGKKK